MNSIDVLNISPVVPVVVLADAKDAVPLAEALLEGGIGVMEVTLRSPAAMASIEQIAKDVPDMAVGAGTVVNADHMLKVKDAGGQFSFSPGISISLLECAKENGISFIPGIATASEMMLAMEYGITACKLFPASAVGGIELLKGFAGPFPDMLFCPTGGIGFNNMQKYLALPNVVSVGGSWIVPKKAIAEGDFHQITNLCKEALFVIG